MMGGRCPNIWIGTPRPPSSSPSPSLSRELQREIRDRRVRRDGTRGEEGEESERGEERHMSLIVGGNMMQRERQHKAGKPSGHET